MRGGSKRAVRRHAVAGAGVAGLLVIAGCGVVSSAAEHNVSITVSPTDEGNGAPIDTPILVTANDGRLTTVKVTGPKGKTVSGEFSPDQTAWKTNGKYLAFNADYKVTASGVDESGHEKTVTETISTIDPGKELEVSQAYFSSGDTVGVGMPIRLEFSNRVTRPKAVEEALQITASKRVVGAWSWNDDKTAVTFRPKQYWPAYTSVKVKAPLLGLQAGKDLYGAENFETKFKIGPRLISTVDAASHDMQVRKNGKLVRTVPITTGKPGFETREGILVLMAKEGTIVMDAATGGTPVGSSEYYRLTVDYSMRITPSGEFLHAAPWSEGSQGWANVSHGCIGMSTGNAAWLWDESRPGDVVIIENTGREQDLGNGITEWNVRWKKWLKDSELGEITVGPARPGAGAPSSAPGNDTGYTS